MTTLKPLETIGTTITNPDNGNVLVRFDNNLEEKYMRDADVTAHPIEDGVPVTDNHQARQRMFELVGEITNTPLVIEQDIPNRAQFYFEVLDALVESGQRLTITSGLKVYDNAVLKSYNVNRNYQNGQALVVALKVVQLEVVSSATVQVPDNILSAVLKASGKSKRKKSTSGQAPTAAQDAKQKESLLYSLFN